MRLIPCLLFFFILFYFIIFSPSHFPIQISKKKVTRVQTKDASKERMERGKDVRRDNGCRLLTPSEGERETEKTPGALWVLLANEIQRSYLKDSLPEPMQGTVPSRRRLALHRHGPFAIQCLVQTHGVSLLFPKSSWKGRRPLSASKFFCSWLWSANHNLASFPHPGTDWSHVPNRFNGDAGCGGLIPLYALYDSSPATFWLLFFQIAYSTSREAKGGKKI